MAVILFVCTGNTCRSSMAVAIAARLARERNMNVEVKSAGIAACQGTPASPEAVRAAAALGIDLKDHRARRLHEDMVAEADIVLTMTAAHRDYITGTYPGAAAKTMTLKEYVNRFEGMEGGSDGGPVELDISDPFGQSESVYHATAAELSRLVEKALIYFQQEQNTD